MHSHFWKIVLEIIKKEKRKSLLMLFVIMGSVITTLIPPLILEKIIDLLTSKQQIVLSAAFSYLFIFALSGILESFQNLMITIMGQKITHRMRSKMSEKLICISTSYFTENKTGQIVSRFVNDVDVVDSLFTNGIISMFADAFKVISIIVIVFIKSKGLGVMICLVTPCLFGMTMIFQKRMRTAQLDNRKAVAKVNQHVPETIKNIRMIHNFSCERFMEDKYVSYIEEGYRAVEKSNFYDSIYSPIIIFTSSLIIALMMIFASQGADMQNLFGLSVGSAVAVIAYVGKVFEPLESLGMEIQNIQTALAGIKRIDEFLNEKEIVKKDSDEQSFMGESDIDIFFKDVSFAYEAEKNILSHQNFIIARGEQVILSGRTGAGKSTIFKLLLGLYPPCEGKVMVKGREAFLIPANEKRKLFGYVEQNFTFVEGSIREQISLFDSTIEDKNIWDSLNECGMKDKIEGMSKKLDTPMKASDFSKGELQLLSIVRALAAKPEIMLLDEITANLDNVTQQHILHIIENVSQGRTVISISHKINEQIKNLRIIKVS